MAFYFPKDNILFTDDITVPSEKEEFIKRNNNPIIKIYNHSKCYISRICDWNKSQSERFKS